MRRRLFRLFAVLATLVLAAFLAPAYSASAAPATQIAPGDATAVELTDGTSILVPNNASAQTKVSMLTDVRERLTEQGMALLNQLMALIPGASGPSTGKLTLTVEPTTGLTSGATVSVSGAGYRAGENIYLAQTIAKPSSGYPSTYADAKKVTVSGAGTFSSKLVVKSSFDSVNCQRTACFIASFTAFPKLADRSQDAWIPISFGGAAQGADTAPSNDATGGTPDGDTARSVGAPSVSVSRASGLNPAGDTVAVSGRGFATSGPGIYVGIAQTDQFSTTDSTSFGSETVWVSTNNGRMRQDGSFSVQLPVKAKFGRADCTANPCAVYTFAAHGSGDRSQDTATGISFVGGPSADGAVDVPADGGASRNKPDEDDTTAGTASTSLSTAVIAPTGVTPITVNGSGFATSGPGVYVGVAETGKFSSTDANSFGAVTWVQPKQISDDGSFSVTLDVEPVFAAGNCIERACAVYTFAAHGSSDRSQDTSSPITVEGSEAAKKAANDVEKKKLAKAQAAEKTAAADGEPSQTAEAAALTSHDGGSTGWWPWALGAGAVVVAAAGGYGLGRRRG